MNGENDIITIFIVAASPIARAGLEAVLQIDERLIVTGSAAEIFAAPSVFSFGQTVDVLLVNVEQHSELVALTEFLSGDGEDTSSPSVLALLSTDFQNPEQAIELLQNGVRGILPTEATAGEIIAAIGAAANNLIVAPPEILETLVSSFTIEDYLPNVKKGLSGEAVEDLTPREREVLEFLVEGESNKVIAYRLHISEHTVKFHVASIFGKLGVNTRTEAVTQALRRGLILL
ncbi:MAG: response regulator transcription factor [Acidobacteria bacterium]|nr:response regulator transcription factor [Acidobacteriota bacterium]MBA4182800.1 response regulator transcription factor [Acidobacteriota bacterium]